MRTMAQEGTTEPISEDQILRRERGQGNIHFPCPADQEDWQTYPVDIYYYPIDDDQTYITCSITVGFSPTLSYNYVGTSNMSISYQ